MCAARCRSVSAAKGWPKGDVSAQGTAVASWFLRQHRDERAEATQRVVAVAVADQQPPVGYDVRLAIIIGHPTDDQGLDSLKALPGSRPGKARTSYGRQGRRRPECAASRARRQTSYPC